ncbi:MAG: hypothetical protein ACXABD_21200 [Candidatus Thorarchaeota archaeon]
MAMSKEEIKKQHELVKEATERWRDVLEAYLDLREKHKVFATAASLAHLDFAGPGLQVAMSMLFHKRNFTMFMEDLLYEDHRQGGVTRLTPPKSSAGKKKGQSKKDTPKFS